MDARGCGRALPRLQGFAHDGPPFPKNFTVVCAWIGNGRRAAGPGPPQRNALRRLALDNHTHSPNPLWIAPWRNGRHIGFLMGCIRARTGTDAQV